MKRFRVVAWLSAVAIAFAIAVSITPASAETATSLVSAGCNPTTTYADCDAFCPDATWTAASGGYYFDYPYPFADDIDIRASQHWMNGAVEGWHWQFKWHAAVIGESRAVVVQVVCIR